MPASIGGYELRGELGRGGLAVVYRAWDPQAQREVALKLLSKTSPKALERFRREGDLTARLDHPNVLRVHAAGAEGAQPWIAYELVPDCRELGEVARELPLRARVELVRDAARALGYAHAQGVVHRDVKSANLLVDSTGRLRVADFGLAHDAGLVRLTQTGGVAGTPTHMAPEQLLGKEGALGPQVDVWALGVVLYELLTDTLPFEGDSMVELMSLITEATPRALDELNPEVPAALAAICLRALERDPARRPAEGEALARALDDWLLGKGEQPTRLGWGIAGLAALAGAGLLLSSVVTPREASPSPAPPGEAAAPPLDGSADRPESVAGLSLERGRVLERWPAEPGQETGSIHGLARARNWLLIVQRPLLFEPTPTALHVRTLESEHALATWPLPAGALGVVADAARAMAATGGPEGIDLWRLPGGESLGHLACREGNPMGFSQDGQRLLVLEAESVSVWDLKERRRTWHLPGEATRARWGQGDALVFVLRDVAVCAFDPREDREAPRFFLRLRDAVDLVQLPATGPAPRVLILSPRGLDRWRLGSPPEWRLPLDEGRALYDLGEGKCLVATPSSILRVDGVAGEILARAPRQTRRAELGLLLPGGGLLEAERDRLITTLPTLRERAPAGEPSLVGPVLAIGGRGETLTVLGQRGARSLRAGKRIARWSARAPLTRGAASPDGARLLACAGNEGVLLGPSLGGRPVTLSSGAPALAASGRVALAMPLLGRGALEPHLVQIGAKRNVTFVGDSHEELVTCSGSSLTLYSTKGDVTRTLDDVRDAHAHGVTILATHGASVLSADDRGGTKLWSASAGALKELRAWSAHERPITALALSETLAASASSEGAIRAFRGEELVLSAALAGDYATALQLVGNTLRIGTRRGAVFVVELE